MALRQFNPVTASLRGTVLINRSELWKSALMLPCAIAG